MAAIAPLTAEHEVIISHGNGPQVGLLALQAQALAGVEAYPLDILGAETEGMIGYLIEQELGNLVPEEKHVATILTMTQVALDDPAFADPAKFVGPVYDEATARRLAAERGWAVKPDGASFRRVVPSPRPQRIVEIAAIETIAAIEASSEVDVREILLSSPYNDAQMEYSGLAWLGETLVLLPQYPRRLVIEL